jgi:single-strand DNA-binding protein
MYRMNSVTLVGNLTKDPELKDRNDMKVCDLRIADNTFREDAPFYIDVSVFRRQAELCAQYLSKGRKVAVTGQLRYSEWETKSGDKRSEHTIDADRVDFLGGGTPRSEGNGGSPESSREPEPVGAAEDRGHDNDS